MIFDKSVIIEEKQKIISQLNDPNSSKKEYTVPLPIQNVSKMCVLTNEAINQEQSLQIFLSNLSNHKKYLTSQKIDTGYIFYIPETLYEQIKSHSGVIQNYIKEIQAPPNQQLIKINNEYIKKAYEGNQPTVIVSESNFVNNLTIPINTGSLSVGTPGVVGSLGITATPGVVGASGSPTAAVASGVPVVVGASGAPVVPGVVGAPTAAVVSGAPGAPTAAVVPGVSPVLFVDDTTLLNEIKAEVIIEQSKLKTVGLLKLCGISNLGNTCYLNSAIQFLYSIIEFRIFFLKISEEKIKSLIPKQTTLEDDDIINKKIMLALKKIFEKMEKKTQLNFNNIKVGINSKYEGFILYNLLSKIDPTQTSLTGQKDAQDLLQFLGFIEDYKESSVLFDYLFKLIYFNQNDIFTCQDKREITKPAHIPYSSHIMLELIDKTNTNFPDNTTITQLLLNYTTQTMNQNEYPIITDDNGEFIDLNKSCGPPVKLTDVSGNIIKKKNSKGILVDFEYNAKNKTIEIEILPEQKYIIIMFKRYETIPNLGTNDYPKINTLIDFEKDLKINNINFKICGIIRHISKDTHISGKDGAHYNYELFDVNGNRFKTLNDSNVLSPDGTLDELKKQAYVLLYRRDDSTSTPPPIVVPPPPPIVVPPQPTNLNDKNLKYLKIQIKAKKGGFQTLQNLFNTDISKNFIGVDETPTDILKDKTDKTDDNRTNIARVVKQGNEHITFSTFKIDDSYTQKLKNFKLSELKIVQLTFQYKELKYLPSTTDEKRVIVATYDVVENINLNELIYKNIPYKIMELTGLTGLTKYTFTKQKPEDKWNCTDTNIKNKTINKDLDKNLFSSNITSIDSHCDNDGNEKIRFYNYDPIQLHITLSQPKKPKLSTEDTIKFETALKHLFSKIKQQYAANSPKNIIVNNNKQEFEFSPNPQAVKAP